MINLNLPINAVSFGQVSTAVLKHLYDLNKDISLFPIGNIDLSTQSFQDENFVKWINQSVQKANESFSRKEKIFKLWHLNGSLQSYSDRQNLLSFYELDNPTKTELNIVKNSENILFSSKYSVEIFKSFGAKNIKYVPLFFDKFNFSQSSKKYFTDNRITFNLVGKLEKRKHHGKILNAWAKKFGNNKKYFLQCSIFNHFIKPEDQTRIIGSFLEGKVYFNIQFLNFMPNNIMYNDYLNSGDIVIGMSGGEGWGLPEFTSLALGKHGIILDAHGYKGWANKENSILVEPTSKVDAYDGIFFHKGSEYNQGQIFDFDADDFISACELAIKKVEDSRVNINGLKLQEEFSINTFLSNIENYI